MKSKVLIVDDDLDALEMMQDLFDSKGYQSHTATNGLEALTSIKNQEPDIVLSDIRMPEMGGMELLRILTKDFAHIPVIMITAHGTIKTAVEAMKVGAKDYILKPLSLDEILAKVERITQLNTLIRENEYLLNKLQQTYDFTNMIGKTDKIQELFRLVKDVATTNTTVLIGGESGVGKELIANAIHYNSTRVKRPFVKVNCGVLAESLFESELFGYTKGAFTDAKENRQGRFEAADGGTLFLDEIGNISLQQQSRLLSVLQNRQVTPLGSNKPIPIDIRLICATNLDIAYLADENKFRKDLIYRINTVEILVPPLRNRGNDIVLLANHFIDLYAEKYFKSSFNLDDSFINKLINYGFPGNVRELQYALERAVIMADSSTLLGTDLVFSPIENTRTKPDGGGLNLETIEKNAILKVIEKNKGNISKSAKELGITRTSLYRRLNKYGL